VISNWLLKSRSMICINTIGLNEWLCTFFNFNSQNLISVTFFTLHFSGIVHLMKEKVHPNLLLPMCRLVGGGQILNLSNVWARERAFNTHIAASPSKVQSLMNYIPLKCLDLISRILSCIALKTSARNEAVLCVPIISVCIVTDWRPKISKEKYNYCVL
jgi:hypothetical protein